MSKRELRKQLAALSFSEKIKILEKLATAAGRLRSAEPGCARPKRRHRNRLPLGISCDKALVINNYQHFQTAARRELGLMTVAEPISPA